MGKRGRSRQPLVITEICYCPGEDGRDMEKLRRVFEILLANSPKGSKKDAKKAKPPSDSAGSTGISGGGGKDKP